jgi:hypothetical protein
MPSGDLPKKPRQVRLQVAVSDAILDAIEDYRFATRQPNRAEAIRQLLKVGQAAQPSSRAG